MYRVRNPTIRIREPQRTANGRRVRVQIDVAGHYFHTVFGRYSDGGISDPIMVSAGLAENPHKVELEAAFWVAARRYRRDNAEMLDALLPR